MPEKIILFCIRHEIDLDHLTPIFSRLRGDSGLPVIGLVFHPTESFQNDWRVRHLKALGVDIFHVVDLIGISKLVRSILLYGPLVHRGGVVSRAWKVAYNRLIWPIVLLWVRWRIDHVDLEALLRDIATPDTVSLLVFDRKISKAYRNLSARARALGIPTVAVPHGSSFGGVESCRKRAEIFDFEIAPDQFCHSGIDLDERWIVIGEPRYDEKWVKKINSIGPKFTPPRASAGCFRIVVMVGKTKYAWFDSEKLGEVLDLLSEMAGVHTVIKSHPRDKEFNGRKRTAVTVADRNTSSASLVRWADLLLFTESSIALDAVALDKPVVYLKFLVNSRPLHESALEMSWGADSLNELVDLIQKLKGDRSFRTYTSEEREKCLSVFVHPVDKDVLGGFFRELMSIRERNALSYTKRGSSGPR